MKIAIITQPSVAKNYGCILQSFALQYYLKNLGHEVETVSLDSNVTWGVWLRRIFKKLYLRFTENTKWNWHALMNSRQYEVIAKNTSCFLEKHLIFTREVFKSYKLLNSKKDLLKYDAYVVGSDQVWRCEKGLSNYVRNCMLEFAYGRKKIKKISYAASFGVDIISKKNKDLSLCKKLLSAFDAISVREDSAVDICKTKFGLEVTQVIDPTLLVDCNVYKKLSYERNDFANQGKLFAYILDDSENKNSIIEKISSMLSIDSFRVLSELNFERVGPNYLDKCVMPPVEQWLRAFLDAEFVVTDSFHGCVFSIIFKKPFIAIGNSNRGMTRFSSLLKLFDLNDRLIDSVDAITHDIIYNPIDYDKVYRILEKERLKANEFLVNALK